MSTEIVRREERGVARQPNMDIIPSSFGEMMNFAEVAHASGMFPNTKNVAAAAMKIAAGAEMGLTPVTSLRSLHVFEGKVEMSAHLMLAQCKAAGYKVRVLQANDQAAVLEWYDPSGELCGPPVGFTIEQANAAGLTKKFNWKAYAEDMLWARAVSRGARRYCSDVMHGIYVDGEISQAPRQQAPQSMPQPAPAIYDPTNDPVSAAAADAHLEQISAPELHPGQAWKDANGRLRSVMRKVGVSNAEIKVCIDRLYRVDSSKKMRGHQLRNLATELDHMPHDEAFTNDMEQFRVLLGKAPTEEMVAELRREHCDTAWRVIALERALLGGGEG